MKSKIKVSRWVIVLAIGLTLALLLTGCTKGPRAEIIESAPASLQQLLVELGAKILAEEIPEGWILGIVSEKTWLAKTEDSVLHVRLQVQTQGEVVTIVPGDVPEDWYVASINSGDLIMFRSEVENNLWDYEDIIIVEKYYMHGIKIGKVGFETSK